MDNEPQEQIEETIESQECPNAEEHQVSCRAFLIPLDISIGSCDSVAEENSFAFTASKHEQCVKGVLRGLAELVELGPQLRERGETIGLDINVTYKEIVAAVALLVPPVVSGSRKSVKRETRRRNQDRRFKLVWDDGSPVLDQEGNEFTYRNRVQVLRGQKYLDLLGEKIANVRLLDTSTDKIINETMAFGDTQRVRRIV